MIAKTPVKHVVVATMGDMLALKGLIVNFVVRRVKKLVPAWSLPGHVAFNAALQGRRGRQLQAGRGRRRTTWPSCNIPAARPAFPRARCSPTATCWPTSRRCSIWLDDGLHDQGRSRTNLVFVCALPLYHIFALTVNALMGMQQGAHNMLIPNPRDIPGFVKELAKYKVNIFPGLNTLFNALLNNEDFRKLDF